MLCGICNLWSAIYRLIISYTPRDSYREKTSALSTEPTTLPRCGTLFTYGRALVIRILRSPFLGKIGSEAMIVLCEEERRGTEVRLGHKKSGCALIVTSAPHIIPKKNSFETPID